MLRTAKVYAVMLPLALRFRPSNVLAASRSGDMEDIEARQIQTAAAAPVSLMMAVAIAEYRSGGRAVYAAAEDFGGQVLYDVKTVSYGDVTQLTVHPMTGSVLYMGHPMISGAQSGAYEFVNLGKLIRPRVSLATAISMAEASADGKGLQARLGIRSGQLIIELDVVTKDGLITEFEVDAISGKVTWMARGSSE